EGAPGGRAPAARPRRVGARLERLPQAHRASEVPRRLLRQRGLVGRVVTHGLSAAAGALDARPCPCPLPRFTRPCPCPALAIALARRTQRPGTSFCSAHMGD